MKKTISSLFLGCALLFLMGCDQDDVNTQDTGGVTLLQTIDGVFPWRVTVNDTDRLILDSLDVVSIVTNPAGVTSALMDVRLQTMEVRFTRADGGTRVPDPLIRNLFASVPVGSSTTLSLTIMTFEQLRSPPLSDLLFENGGFDSETGRTNIKMNAVIRFYGETVGGKRVTSESRELTMEFVP